MSASQTAVADISEVGTPLKTVAVTVLVAIASEPTKLAEALQAITWSTSESGEANCGYITFFAASGVIGTGFQSYPGCKIEISIKQEYVANLSMDDVAQTLGNKICNTNGLNSCQISIGDTHWTYNQIYR